MTRFQNTCECDTMIHTVTFNWIVFFDLLITFQFSLLGFVILCVESDSTNDEYDSDYKFGFYNMLKKIVNFPRDFRTFLWMFCDKWWDIKRMIWKTKQIELPYMVKFNKRKCIKRGTDLMECLQLVLSHSCCLLYCVFVALWRAIETKNENTIIRKYAKQNIFHQLTVRYGGGLFSAIRMEYFSLDASSVIQQTFLHFFSHYAVNWFCFEQNNSTTLFCEAVRFS